jgi:hypothetical protein
MQITKNAAASADVAAARSSLKVAGRGPASLA